MTSKELLGRSATSVPTTIEGFEAMLTELKALGSVIVQYDTITKSS